MKIAYLGAGTWGFALASLLAAKGHDVVLWTVDPAFAELLSSTHEHPKLPKIKADPRLRFTSNLKEALEGADWIIESVTSKGLRPVFEQVRSLGPVEIPVVITSKGIEQNSGLLLPEVIIQVLGDSSRERVGCLSGPSHAEEVIQQLPTSVVASSYDPRLMHRIVDLFTTSFFRVYPNADIMEWCLVEL